MQFITIHDAKKLCISTRMFIKLHSKRSNHTLMIIVMFLLSYGYTFIFVLFIHLVIHSLNKYLLSTFNVSEKILLSKDKNKVGTQG